VRVATCAECGVFMNCDEIDAAYLPERDEWTCGPCVRTEHECHNDMCCYGRTGAAGAVIDVN
jgi:hypothetical protein